MKPAMQRKAKKVNKVVCIGCAAGVVAASVSILCGAAACIKANRRLDKSDFLKTDDKPCRTDVSFAENADLSAASKKHLTGVVQINEDISDSAEPSVTVEVYDAPKSIPNAGEKKNSADPVKFVYGTATLVGVGTLAGLTKKKDE